MENKQNLMLPMAVIIAGIIISGTVYYTNKKESVTADQKAKIADADKVANPFDQKPEETKPADPKPITDKDHVLGNPNADLTFIIYTDTECPYCKRFNETTNQMMADLGKAGKVRLVFRHFPLDSLHKKSRKEAEAAECASDIGGPDKFWEYIDRLFSVTPSNDKLDPAELPKIAKFVGVDETKFNECLASGKFAARVQENQADALAAGGTGTPFFVIINKKGQVFPAGGALPYSELKLALNQLIEESNK